MTCIRANHGSDFPLTSVQVFNKGLGAATSAIGKERAAGERVFIEARGARSEGCVRGRGHWIRWGGLGFWKEWEVEHEANAALEEEVEMNTLVSEYALHNSCEYKTMHDLCFSVWPKFKWLEGWQCEVSSLERCDTAWDVASVRWRNSADVPRSTGQRKYVFCIV